MLLALPDNPFLGTNCAPAHDPPKQGKRIADRQMSRAGLMACRLAPSARRKQAA
jgi:hypothetical protein